MARVVGLDFSFSHSYENTPEFREFLDVYNQFASRGRTRRQQIKHFSDAFDRIRQEYVNVTNDGNLLNAAIAGILELKGKKGAISPTVVTEAALDSLIATLDPHSSYLNPEEYKESRIVTTGEFGGLGIEINMDQRLKVIRVISPIADTPASRAGLKAGDLITHVNGVSIKGMSLRVAVKRLRGKPGTRVRISIKREGFERFRVDIIRAVIRVQPIKWTTEGNIGVIRVTQFISNSDIAMEEALEKLVIKLNYNLDGLVLDLRNNPGGLLNQSIAVVDAFLKRGEIVSVRNRTGSIRGYNAGGNDLINGIPIVVLINKGSASASEIVAGALQDHGRAIIMGRKSFGKGSVQTISPLKWNGALRLTTALYYLPSGRTIQGVGVTPDIKLLSGKDNGNRKLEVDLPNALKSSRESITNLSRHVFEEDDCPGLGKDSNDKILGCAIMYIKSGTEDDFVLLMRRRSGKVNR